MLFDGASLILYICGVIVYLANIVKGLRATTNGAYTQGREPEVSKTALGLGSDEELLSREDSLRVMAASNTILALVMVGVLVLQAGQWYAQRMEQEELAEFRKKRAVAAQEKSGSKKKN